jgi:paraquat-inducible protein A
MRKSKNIDKIIACPDCGQLAKLPGMPDRTIARCSRCGAKLFHNRPDTVDRTLALSFTSLILFIIAVFYPFLAMRIEGFVQPTKLLTGVFTLYQQDMPGLSLLVSLTAFILPLFQILGLIYIYLPIKLGWVPWKTAEVFRAIRYLRPWGMMEIYMLGILVSMIKFSKMATIVPGVASGAFMVLICVLTATLSGLNPEDIWKQLPVKGDQHAGEDKNESNFSGCHSCTLLYRKPLQGTHCICPRCHTRLHFRKKNSLSRTWALVIAAAILYFPANIFPATLTSRLGHEQADTILSGVIYFLFSGSWHIALIIFVASVLVPLMKLIILVYLLLSVYRDSSWKPEDRTRLYRMGQIIGRWSMVDVYVATILVSLVQLSPLANIIAGPGVIYFSAVVVITMFASESFDPRLIWDVMEESKE